MRLTFSTRTVGEVLVMHCAGRIVAGPETDTLHAQLKNYLSESPDIVLVLGQVEFVDSSGLGTLVRLVAKARAMGGDLKLCAVPPHLEKTLRMTNLNRVFETHPNEADAISACYERCARRNQEPAHGATVLCVEQSPDLLSYFTELLRRAGYRVLGSSNCYDAQILLRAARPNLVLMGPRREADTAGGPSLNGAEALPILVLEDDFLQRDPGEAGEMLLQRVRAALR